MEGTSTRSAVLRLGNKAKRQIKTEKFIEGLELRSLRGSCWAGAGFLEEGPCGAGIQTSRRGCQLASSAGFSDVWLQGVVQLALHIRGCRTPGYTGPTELCHFIDGT